MKTKDVKMSGSENEGRSDRGLPYISVRQAAERMGVSQSKVYRINRTDGPFRFVVAGRRIFIDAADFERHLSKASIVPDERAAAIAARDLSRLDNRAAIVGSRKSSGCGQRELTFPDRNRQFIVVYTW